MGNDRAPRSYGRWRLVALFVLLGSGALVLHSRSAPVPSLPRSGPTRIPVTAAVAVSRDVPVYLNGLGTVTAFNTVTVKTRVDGQLNRVLFREGQSVHQGQLLADIDPAVPGPA
jgi:multidrug efflux system membrane fusion protein